MVMQKRGDNNISRRKYLARSVKYGGLGLIITVLPILIRGDSKEIIRAIEKLDKYTLSFNYLYSLSKREGSAYIQGIYYAVRANKISRNKAEEFLGKIFDYEDLLWMREEAVKVLIKLDMLTDNELDELIDNTSDESVLISAASALGEKDTPGATRAL
ncbi:unnamed protein product, partial [marine sediment metagenome]